MKITNINNLPAPFVSAVEREYQYKEKQYSVTQLLKGSCEAVLERRHHNEIESDVSDMIWLIFGTAVHSILENAEEEREQLKENKKVINVDGGYKLSGIFDLYDAVKKKVTDYKTASVWKVIFNDWEDYRKQLLIYAYMLRKIGFECDSGEIIATLKDHSKTKAKVDKSYPKFPVHKVAFNFSENDFEEIEHFIKKRFNEIRLQEALEDNKLIPCTPDERWHKDDKYAVMKEGRKSALKVCSSETEAKEYMTNKNLDKKHYIEFREGQDTKCDDYCNVKQWCPFYGAKHRGGKN